MPKVSFFDHDSQKVVTIHAESESKAAIITLLDRIAAVLERYVDNRQ